MKAEVTNPITGSKMNLGNPFIWLGAILFVVFLLIVFGGGRWIVNQIKGITGIGTTTGDGNDIDRTLL